MKTFTRLFAALIFLSALIAAPPARADRQADIQKAEAYLQNLKTLKADFTQINHNGGKTTGTFYLNRPGKLRFEYDNSGDFIVADGIFIYYYDSEMKQQSNTTISNSLADFLLRDVIRLGGDISVTDINRNDGLLNIAIALKDDPGAGKLVLGFSEEPMQLRRWHVVDAQGLTTQIVLKNIETGLNLSRRLFYYHDPERGRPNYN